MVENIGCRTSGLAEKWFDLIVEQKDELAKLITLENGKPYAEAQGEVLYSAGYIEWSCGGSEAHLRKNGSASVTNKRIIVTHQGVGPVAAITPWNFPAAIITRKAAPALAAGCTFIIKPAPDTPLTALELVRLGHEAGIPKESLNV